MPLTIALAWCPFAMLRIAVARWVMPSRRRLRMLRLMTEQRRYSWALSTDELATIVPDQAGWFFQRFEPEGR